MARSDSSAEATEKKPGRLRQIVSAYKMTKESQPYIGLLLAGIFLAVVAVFLLLGLIIGSWPLWLLTGVPLGLLAAVIVFGRRVEKAAYNRLEGQLGAGANALSTLRRGWKVESGIAVTRNQDVVHRAVGRPGIVLVGEGAPNRVTNLLAVEKRKHARVAPDTPIHTVVVGDGEGEVPLRKLSSHVMKLPRAIKPADVTDVLNRIKALSAHRQQLPVPKGPLPKGTKMPPGTPRPR